MKIQLPQLSAVLILFARLAAAQVFPPEPGDFKVTVPFDFTVGKLALLSGDYVVHREKASNRLQICEDGVICEVVEAAALTAAETPAQPKLVFSNCGDTHLLWQIWIPDGTGLQLATSSLDSEPGRKEGQLESVTVQGDVLCIHKTLGLPSSWH